MVTDGFSVVFLTNVNNYDLEFYKPNPTNSSIRFHSQRIYYPNFESTEVSRPIRLQF